MKKLEALLDIYLSDLKIDIIKKILHFEIINKSMLSLTNCLFQNNSKIKYHQLELESKFIRHGFSNQSIMTLVKGIKFELLDKEIELVDITAVIALTRMQIELFLIMFYLFFDDVADLEKGFRYDIYKLHGLQKQKNFKETFPTNITNEFRKKIEIEITNTLESIRGSKIFANSSDKEKKEYLNPRKPKLIDGKELFIKSKIATSRINEIWSLYSNISHAEHIGDRQFNHYQNNPSDINESISFLLSINSILTSNLVLLLKNSFECIENEYNKLETDKLIYIETWAKIGTQSK